VLTTDEQRYKYHSQDNYGWKEKIEQDYRCRDNKLNNRDNFPDGFVVHIFSFSKQYYLLFRILIERSRPTVCVTRKGGIWRTKPPDADSAVGENPREDFTRQVQGDGPGAELNKHIALVGLE
jgi:hypothetical protein